MKIINLITKKQLKELDDIDRKCIEMHVIPPAKMFLNLKVHDRDKKQVLDYSQKSNSWVRNNYNFITTQQMGIGLGKLGATYGAGYMIMKTTGGTNKTNTDYVPRVEVTGDNYSAYAASGVTDYGIVAGTGAGAESFEDYALGTLIANGTGAGQMSYAATTYAGTSVSYAAGTKKYTQTLVRIINNNSGGAITVTEVGIYVNLFYGSYVSSNTENFMLARDLLGSSVEVADGGQLTVTYTIEMTYPS